MRVFAFALTIASATAHAVPSFADVKAAHRPSDVTITDRHGVPIQTVRVDKTVRRLRWVPIEEMSPALLRAIVLSEDRRFWTHGGVDWRSAAASAWANLWNTKTRGASTLTMQLAGLVDEGLARPRSGRSVAQKLDQALIATRLEATWQKNEILEAYLNSVPFRGEIAGVEALAETLFAKHASGLDAHEAAIAAALLRAPNARPAEVAQRACGVLQLEQMPCTGVAGLAESALARRGAMPLGEQIAPHFARRIVAADGTSDGGTASSASAAAQATTMAGGVQRFAWRATSPAPAPAYPRTIDAGVPLFGASAPSSAPAGVHPTTIDAGVQRFAVRALRRQLAELAGRNVEDGAVVVLDNASGEVLAWVGSSGDLSGAAAVDGVLARRQPGSTLKPFVYELAFEKRLVTPATLLDDSPAQIATAAGLYLPQNYDRGWKGFVSARTALGASLNVPAVRVGAMLGPDALLERLNAFGLALPQSAGWYGAALPLGSADVTLLDLTNAYRTLANGGLHSNVVLQRPAATPSVPAGAPTTTLVDDATPAARPAIDAAQSRGAVGAATVRRVADAGAATVRRVADPAAATVRRVAHAGAATSRRVADAAASHLVADILADNNARVRTFGLASALATRGFAAVKTGTSKDMRDNWCIGFTDRYTVGVWTGNASGQAMHDVSGTSGAAPVWQAIVAHLHAGSPSRAPGPPAGVVGRRIAFDGQREAERDELFLAGTERAVVAATSEVVLARRFGIASPRDGSIFAIDPDIPPAAQRITFEGERGTWHVDGKAIGAGESIRWAPWPGRHRVTLVGADGRTLQAVSFEVRGAGVKGDKRSAAGP